MLFDVVNAVQCRPNYVGIFCMLNLICFLEDVHKNLGDRALVIRHFSENDDFEEPAGIFEDP